MTQLDGDVLGQQTPPLDVVDDRPGPVHAQGGGEDGGRWARLNRGPPEKIELVLESDLDLKSQLPGPGDGAAREVPGPAGPRLPGKDHVAHDPGVAGSIGQLGEGGPVGVEPDLADGTEGRCRGQPCRTSPGSPAGRR